MLKNVGPRDKIIRYALAGFCAVLAFKVSRYFWIPAGVLAMTAALGFCEVYRLLGINTFSRK